MRIVRLRPWDFWIVLVLVALRLQVSLATLHISVIMYTNLRFSHRNPAPVKPRHAHMSVSPYSMRGSQSTAKESPYEVRSFPRGNYTDPRDDKDKLFFKHHGPSNPFLPSLQESKQNPDHLSKNFVPIRQADPPRVNTQPPDDVYEAVFEIYATRYSSNYSKPLAAGVLISPSLALTTHNAIPTADTGFRCHLQFISNGEFYKFAPRIHFRTHSALNLTIISVEPINKTVRRGLRVRHTFSLQEHGRIYLASGSSGPIEQLDTMSFFFYSQEPLLQGTPLFDYNWELVGLTLTSVSHVRFNEGRRVDMIHNFVHSTSVLSLASMAPLDSMRSLAPLATSMNSPSLASTMSTKVLMPSQSLAALSPASLTSSRSHAMLNPYRTVDHLPMRTDLVHWFMWGSRAVMTYDIKDQTWKTVTATLTNQFQEYPWSFLHDSRSVILPDQSIMLVGGTIAGAGTSMVLRYYPSTGTVSPSPSMLNARQCVAVCYLDECVYVIGGIEQNKSAERYSLTRELWQYILPTNYERFEASAVAYEKNLFVAGGSASDAAGQTIERFSSVSGEWEVLRILLPRPLINPGLCALSHSRIAILGGRKTRRVYVLQCSFSSSFNLQEATAFPEDVESVYPVVHLHRQLLVFNSTEGKDRPVLIKYSENCFTAGDFILLEN